MFQRGSGYSSFLLSMFKLHFNNGLRSIAENVSAVSRYKGHYVIKTKIANYDVFIIYTVSELTRVFSSTSLFQILLCSSDLGAAKQFKN